MKVPLSWLKEYVEIGETVEKLSEDLLLSGTKVESIEKTKDDTIFDFEITPNRADCLSLIGIAREIAAIYNRRLTIPAAFTETQNDENRKKVVLRVLDKGLCPFYTIGVIDGIKVGRSPTWLAERLEKSGIRSLSNIVDITNYVMTETGQPMHAFDYDKIEGAMILRASKVGETVTTLDGVERKLPSGAIIIEDNKKLIDLAGLMGGASSEIDESTQTVVLHVPVYNSLSVRRASQALGLRTEASNRFEKNLDPAAHRYAFERAYSLIKTLGSGRLVSKVESIGYPPAERHITLPTGLINKHLGTNISNEEIINILSRLEFETKLENKDGQAILTVGIPTFRTDINYPIDIAEEVARIYGYNKFPKTLPTGSLPASELKAFDFEGNLKRILVSLGLREIYSDTLTSLTVLGDLGIDNKKCLKVANRLVIDYEYLRPTLLVGLILAAKTNIENYKKFSLFEVGRVFSSEIGKDKLPIQPKKIAAILVDYDFLTAKGVLEGFLNKLNMGELTFKKAQVVKPYGSQQASTYSSGTLIGMFGSIDSNILNKFEVPVSSFAFELDLDILQSKSREPRFLPIPRYPIVKEEISIFLPESLTFEDILDTIKKAAGENLYATNLIEDTKIRRERSVLIGLEYYSKKHTLDKNEVERIRNKVINNLRKIGAKPRTN
jgi:phenylalanyl-tRNA synthetase beta chain